MLRKEGLWGCLLGVVLSGILAGWPGHADAIPPYELVIAVPEEICEGLNSTASVDELCNYVTGVGGLEFNWQVTGAGVLLDGNDTCSVSWEAIEGGIATISLTVVDTLTHLSYTNSTTVTVNDIPGFELIADSGVCEGTNSTVGIHLTELEGGGGVGLDYAWVVTGAGVLLEGNGTGEITWAATEPGVATICATVTNSSTLCAGSSCVTVNVGEIPQFDLQVLDAVCEGVNATASVNLTPLGGIGGQVGLDYAWAVTGAGVLLEGNGTGEITWEATEPGTATICLTVTNSTFGCLGTHCVTVNVGEIPQFDLQVPDAVCEGVNATASVELPPGFPENGLGLDLVWEVTGAGVLIDGNGTLQITWEAVEAGNATICLMVGNSTTGCTATGCLTVRVDPAPLGCAIEAPESVLYGSTGNWARTVETPGAAYAWDILVDGVVDNNLITSGQNTREIAWTAPNAFGVIQIGVVVTTSNGCECINDPAVGGDELGVRVRGVESGQPIPAFTGWGVVFFGLLLAVSAVGTIRRGKKGI